MSDALATPAAEPTRRDFLVIATGTAAVVGTAAAIWPFISSLAPDSEVIAAGAPIELDLTPIATGQIVKVFWRGKLIFVRHRFDVYHEVFDPYGPPEKPSAFRISDDLAGVVAELRHGLVHYREGRVSEALWWWQFSYLSNWGSTCTAVLRVVAPSLR